MNRLIKFRAYVPYLKEMIQPCFVEIFSDGSFSIGRPGEGGNTIRDKFDDIVLMQFTGFKDKNGKEIYEGDIIQFDASYIKPTKVYWNEEMTGFYPLISERPQTMTVIGNVYENPELITPNSSTQ